MRNSFFKKNRAFKSETSQEISADISAENGTYFSHDLDWNVEHLKALYSYPKNVDFTIREIIVGSIHKRVVLFFIPSLTDATLVQEDIIKPLIMNDKQTEDLSSAMSVSSIKREKKIRTAIEEMNTGETLLFIEEDPEAFVIKTSKSIGRSVDKPQNETTLLGPKESFIENADANISLVRQKIRSEDFTVEKMKIGTRSHNEIYILYNRELAGAEVLDEVKARLRAIDKDSVQNTGLLLQHIEDRKKSLVPTVLQTERPDRAASFIEDGYVAIVMNNSPFALVVPATFWSFFHSADDHYMRFLFGNATRVLRMLAMFITVFTSSAYIAITTFHIEMLPTDLLLAIAGAREMVPMPAFLELLVLELAFELIREAGIRVPVPIGPTIGIVGALILGQAGVEANVFSPIVVIVVALSGLSSYAVNDLNLNYAARIIRFAFLLGAGLFGIFGMICCFILCLMYLGSIKSFGVPYMAPLTPKYTSSGDTIFRKILKKEWLRPEFTKTKDLSKDTNPNK